MPNPAPRGVLVTRPEPGAGETAARLRALEFVPILAPVLTIRPLAADLPEPGALQAVLVASARAVEALPAAYRSLPLLAVGAATAERARCAGHVLVESADADAAALAGLAARTCQPERGPLLLAARRGQGGALAAALSERGFRVEQRSVYAAEPVPALPAAAQTALAERRVAAAVFFSADSARAFARSVKESHLASRLGEVEALAISARVAEVLAPLPWRRVRAALRPNQDDVLALLA